RCLVCYEVQPARAKIEEGKLRQRLAKGDPAPQDSMSLGRDLSRVGQRAGCVVARVGLADVAGKWTDRPCGVAFRRWEERRRLCIRNLVGAVEVALLLVRENLR